MTPDTLLKLAERCEAASADEQSALIEQAWIEIFVGCGGDLNTANWSREAVNRWDEFQHFLEAKAFLDAAMSLVPEGEKGWPQLIYRGPNPNNLANTAHRVDLWMKTGETKGRHPTSFALALTAASLRARAAMENKDD